MLQIEKVLDWNRKRGILMSHPGYKANRENYVQGNSPKKSKKAQLIPIEFENQHVLLEEEK